MASSVLSAVQGPWPHSFAARPAFSNCWVLEIAEGTLVFGDYMTSLMGSYRDYMVVSQNKGTPIYYTPYYWTPKKVPLILGNPHIVIIQWSGVLEAFSLVIGA